VVGGKEQAEYLDSDEPSDGASHVTRYVESVSGAKFGIKFLVSLTFKLTSAGLKFAVFVDGRYVQHVIFDDSDRAIQPHQDWTGYVRGTMRWKLGSWWKSAFRFRDVFTGIFRSAYPVIRES